MPQQVQTELSSMSGVEQARQLSVTPPAYSLCFSLGFPPPERTFPAPNLRHTISLILAKGIKQSCCVSWPPCEGGKCYSPDKQHHCRLSIQENRALFDNHESYYTVADTVSPFDVLYTGRKLSWVSSVKSLMTALRPPGCVEEPSGEKRNWQWGGMHVRSMWECVWQKGGCRSACLSAWCVSLVLTGLSMFYCAETAGFPRGPVGLAMQSQAGSSRTLTPFTPVCPLLL